MSAGLCVPQGEYEVKDILAVRWKGRERQFLIRWKGYDDDENSWEVRACPASPVCLLVLPHSLSMIIPASGELQCRRVDQPVSR